MTFKTIDLTPRIGTEIIIDRDTLLKGSDGKALRRLLEERGVLAFRGANLNDEEQVVFAQTLGDVMAQGEKGIYKVTLDKKESASAEYLLGAFYWHFDGALDDVPSLATLLTGRKLALAGGETEFCNTYAAYDDLPDAEKKYLETLRVVHAMEASQRLVHPDPTSAQLQEWRDSRETKTHPLVWKHKSGRKSLLVGASAHYIVDMPQADSDALLRKLLDWTTEPRYVYQHRWRLGDLVIWDNTGTLHRATHYSLESGRMMHRTALVGEEAVA